MKGVVAFAAVAAMGLLALAGFVGYSVGTEHPGEFGRAKVLCPQIGGVADVFHGEVVCVVGNRFAQVPQ